MKPDSNPSAGTEADSSNEASVTTSSPNSAKPNVVCCLSPDEIEEGNILIAKFMGVKQHPKTEASHYYGGYKEWEFPGLNVWYETELLQYDSHWSWLMPVVEKIENFGYRVNFCYSPSAVMPLKNIISIEKYEVGTSIYEGDENENKLNAVWVACVEFIKWWNKQNAVSER